MIVRLTRLNPTHHRFEAIRDDGTRELRELETRAFLRHDLVHFAVESEACLQNSFYGMLARGGDLDNANAALDGEAWITEAIVGPFQTALKDKFDAATFVARVRDYLAVNGREPPNWFTEEFASRVGERMRRLEGQWRATPFGQTMELQWRRRA